MNFKLRLFLHLIVFTFYTHFLQANVWNVGYTRTYTIPGQIKNLVQDGDSIYIDEGVYMNDAVKWNKNNLTFIGLGAGAILQYNGDIPNGKGIWVFESPGTSDNAYIENIIFDGARVSDDNGANGAGIRYQANNLTVNKCVFRNCQNGILEGHGSVASSNVVILNSEFVNNGYELPNDPDHSGYEHHIYISASADTLIVMNNFFHHPRGQANSLKTRAQRSFILYNLIDEEATGYGSWELNIAQGGLNIIMGNTIIQGESGANHGIISWDDAINSLEDFYFINNTVINKYPGNAKFFNVSPSSGINTFKVYNNIFASVAGASNTMFAGHIPAVVDTSHNAWSADYEMFGFTDPSTNDFSLTEQAVQAINAGIDAEFTNTGFPLSPDKMYQSFHTALIPRSIQDGVIDLGAYEYTGTTSTIKPDITNEFYIFPNPFQNTFHIYNSALPGKPISLRINDLMGHNILSKKMTNDDDSFIIDASYIPSGMYVIEIVVGGKTYTRMIVKI